MERRADTEILGCGWQKPIVNISLRVPGMVLLLCWGSENDATCLLASLQPFDPDLVDGHLCFQERKKGNPGKQLSAVLLACFSSASVFQADPGCCDLELEIS